MAQVIQHAHEQHEVKPFPELSNSIHGEIAKLNVHLTYFGREAGLVQILSVSVDTDNPFRTALLHLDRVKACVAADVEHRFAGQVRGNGVCKVAPFDFRVVAEEVVGSSFHAAQVEVVKPLAQLSYSPANLVFS